MKAIDTKLEELFEASVKLSKELKRLGINIEAFSEQIEGKALGLGPQSLMQVVVDMNNETERFSALEDCENNKQWEYQHLWSFLKEHKFKFSDDLFQRLEDGYFLEVYGMNAKAIYRSPNFYKMTSYTLADLFVSTWEELYDRKGQYTLQLMQAMYKSFEAPARTVLSLDIEPHSCSERYSPEKRSGLVEPLFFSTVESRAGEKFVITANKVTNVQ